MLNGATANFRADVEVKDYSDNNVGLDPADSKTFPVGQSILKFSGEIETFRKSVSVSYGAIGQITIEDNSAYYITARVVAMKTDGSSRAAYTSSVLVYRDGGDATIETDHVDQVEIESDGWPSHLDWSVSGNVVNLIADAAEVADIYWVAKISYVRALGA
jgi:hypothetical protein